jgi:hypothetical protein
LNPPNHPLGTPMCQMVVVSITVNNSFVTTGTSASWMFRTMLFCLSNPVDRQTNRIHARFVSHRVVRIDEAYRWVLLMMPLHTATE